MNREGEFHDRVRAATREHQGVLGYLYRNLATGEEFGARDDELFPMASVFKVPVMIECFRLAAAGQLCFAERLRVPGDRFDHGSGVLRYAFDGVDMTVADLIRFMITFSDNIAADMLLEKIGIEQVNGTMRRLGFPNTHVGWYCRQAHYALAGMADAPFTLENDRIVDDRLSARSGEYEYDAACCYLKTTPANTVTTPREMADVLERIYRGDMLSEADSKGMLEMLSAQAQHDGCVEFLPASVRFAGKSGAFFTLCADAVIVFHPRQPFVLTAFNSDMPLRHNGFQTLARLGKAVWDWVDGS